MVKSSVYSDEVFDNNSCGALIYMGPGAEICPYNLEKASSTMFELGGSTWERLKA